MWRDKLQQAEVLLKQAEELATNPTVTAEDRERITKLLEEARKLRADAVLLKDIEVAAREVQASTAAVPDAKAQRPAGFTDWGDFLQAVHQTCVGMKADPRLTVFVEKKDLSESVGSSGGFLVPPEFLTTIQAVQAESSIVRPRATVIRMARRQVNIPVLDQTETTAGKPHWFGGLTFYWSEEGEEKTESDPKFRQVSLVAHKLIGYTRASDELVDDAAISLSDFLAGPMGFAGGVAWMEDYAFLQGTGVGQPMGVVNAGATITVARASTSTPIQYVDLVNMYEAFLPTGRGVWIFNQSAISSLLALTDNAGNYIWLPNMQNVAGNVANTLFGLPVIFTEKNPTVGNAGDVILADFRYYLVGDRQATTVESTKFDRWRYDQTSWRVVHRVDGRPWLSAPLTLQDGSTQVSPFVILGAKST